MHRGHDPTPELKQQLADKILELLDGRSSTWAAWAAHMPRSRILEMRHGNLENVSLERLVRCLAELNHTVQVTIMRNRTYGA